MNRRRVLSLLGFPAAMSNLTVRCASALAQTSVDNPDIWTIWKSAFLSDSGRVVDNGQANVSHSEGQGYGMLLAVFFGDEEAFARMLGWTQSNLAVRNDPLLAWRWVPGPAPQVSDYNNATDGDLFYAWSLLRAAVRFGTSKYAELARRIATFVTDSCVVDDPRGGNRLLLLPGLERFSGNDKVTINPSYYMPLALRELAASIGHTRLWQCADDGLALLSDVMAKSRVPNWIDVDAAGWQPSAMHPAVSGYDALRVPLWLAWSGLRDRLLLSPNPAPIEGCTLTEGEVPTVVELSTGQVRETSTYAGYGAIVRLARCSDASTLPPYVGGQPYFPATLHLLTFAASQPWLR